LGIFLGYQIPDMHWYPECHLNAYQPTQLPLVLSCSAGLITLLVVWAYAIEKPKP
jgi:hypothetical protein